MDILDSNFNDIQHIGIPVTDLENSKCFYEKLGFEEVMSKTFSHNGQTGNASMMKRSQTVIELYQLPENELDEIRALKDGHVNHIAVGVSDVDKAFSELKGAGFNIVEDSPVFLDFWEKGCKYFNILGPEGERLEFNQIL
jgi:catechol 2,3-dioxygenase-like lactoylglutathione lyase family enzyme